MESAMQKIHNGFRISIEPSIYTTRVGLFDLRIQEESDYGAFHDGRRYITDLVLDLGTKEKIRFYRNVPMQILQYALQLASEFITTSGVTI